MKCPKCRGNTKVYDSRPTIAGVRRRRECLKCGFRFTTFELPYTKMLGYAKDEIEEDIESRFN